MNRRKFLEWLGLATAGTVVAAAVPEVIYSFPSVIVPQNIISVTEAQGRAFLATHVSSTANWIDFYAQQLIKSKQWYVGNASLWNALDHNPNHRGVKFVFNKTI